MVTTPPPSEADCAGRPTGEVSLTDRLLRRLRSPGLIDSAAVQDAVRRRLERSGRLFPLLERLLARAAEDGAGGFLTSGMPLAEPLAFGAGDPVTAPLAVPIAFGAGAPV